MNHFAKPMRIFALCVLAGCFFYAVQASTPSPTLASPLAAQEGSNFTLQGKITDRSPGKLTVSSGDNMIFTVRYDDKTEIKRSDGSAGASKDLRVGVNVNVEGDLTESGDVVAHKIELLESPAKNDHPAHR